MARTPSALSHDLARADGVAEIGRGARQRRGLPLQLAADPGGVHPPRPLGLAHEHRAAAAQAGQDDGVDLGRVLALPRPERPHPDDLLAQRAVAHQAPKVHAERLLPARSQVAVQVVHPCRRDLVRHASIDLGAIAVQHAEPEREEVVRDPVRPVSRAPGVLRDGNDALDEAELLQALQHGSWVPIDDVADLVVLRAASRDGVQHLLPPVVRADLRVHDDGALVEQPAPRLERQRLQVLGHASVLVPPAQVERGAADDPPHARPVGRREVRQHLGRLVRPEGMDQQGQVEAAVQRLPVRLHRGHGADR